MIKNGSYILCFFIVIASFASESDFDDLDALLDNQDQVEPITLKAPSAFKSKYVVNLSTTEMLSPKAFEFRISIR